MPTVATARPTSRTNRRPLITVPLIILAVCSLTVGFLNNATSILHIGEVHRVGRGQPAGQHVPRTRSTPPFHWSGALLSIGVALAGAIVSYFVCIGLYERSALGRSDPAQQGGAARAYAFLWNKYYLDALYENVIIAGIKGPIAKLAYWFNQPCSTAS